MDYLAQLLTRDRHREFLREADDARLRNLTGVLRASGRPSTRNRQRPPFREVK